MKQRMGKYDEARKYYDLYISEFGGIDSLFTAKAKKEIASVDFCQEYDSLHKKECKIRKIRRGHQFNSFRSRR